MEFHCKTHDTPFFKKGKMKNYAHPIGDTGEWCNMPEDTKPVQPKAEPRKATPYRVDPPSTNLSIEQQSAYKGGIELLVNKIITPDSHMGKATIDWGLVKLTGVQVGTLPIEKAVSAPVEQETVSSEEIPLFKSAGDMLNYSEKHGIPAQTVRELVGASNPADLINWNLNEHKGDWNLAWAEILKRWKAQ